MSRRSRLWSDPRVKPPLGSVEINWAHPLAQGLVNGWLLNEAGGLPLDIVARAPVTSAGTRPAWGPSTRGVVPTWTADGAFLSAAIAAEPAARPISCFGYVYPTVDNYQQVMSRFQNTGWRYRMNSGRTIAILDRGGTNVLTSNGTCPLNTWTSVGVAMSSAGLAVLLNGKLDNSNATAFGGGNSSTEFAFGANDIAATSEVWRGHLDTHWKWARRLSTDEFAWLHAEPYIVCRPLIRRRYFVAAGGGAITGTGAVTAATAALSGTGAETFTGTGALVAPVASLASAAAETFTGTGALTAPVAALAAAALETFTGTGGVTAPAAALAGTGAEGFAGTGAVAAPPAALAATGAETFVGTGTITAPVASLAGVGAEAITTEVPESETVGLAETLTSTVTPAPVTGTGAVTAPLAALSGVGVEAYVGTGALAAPVATLAATGAESVVGPGAVTAPAAALQGDAAETFTGTGAITVPLASLAGSEQPAMTGTGAILAPVASIDGVGEVGEPPVVVVVPPSVGGAGVVRTLSRPVRLPKKRRQAVPEPPPAIVGSGAILAPLATLKGIGTVANPVTGRGQIQAPLPLMVGAAFNDELEAWYARQAVIRDDEAIMSALLSEVLR